MSQSDENQVQTSVSQSEQQTQTLGERLAMALFERQPKFVRLKGPLGAGKSSFARGFIRQWLALSGEVLQQTVVSPTYNIAKVYGTRMPVAHLDLYRIESMRELEHIGFEHYFFEVPCCLVEWLEQVPGAIELIPDGAVEVEFSFDAFESERIITIRGSKTVS